MNDMKKKMIIPCVRGVQGDWVHYSSVMDAQQIADWVEAAKDIKVARSLDEYLQRTLKAREKEIATYILENEHHFFNSLLIGVYEGVPELIEFDLSKKFGELGREVSENDESVGLLIFNGQESMFAIDGQHRVKGIIEALKIDNDKPAPERNIVYDKFPIIFLAHIDDENGRKRTRRLFSDINKKAKAIPMKDTVIIDEEDISAIVARKVFAENKYFNNGKLIDIESDSRNLEKDNITHFTNLSNLYTAIRKLKPLYKKAEDSKEIDDVNIQSLYAIVNGFIEFVVKNKIEYNKFFVKKTITLKKLRRQNRHLLFRPIGFTLIARIYAHFSKTDRLYLLEKHINKLSFIMPNSPFNRILWNNGKMEADSKNQTLAYNLSLYLFREKVPRKTIRELTSDFRNITKNDLAPLPEQIHLD